MKGRSLKKSRAANMLVNGVLSAIVFVIGVVCFLPGVSTASGTDDDVYYKGNAQNAVSVMFNVYWGTEIVYEILDVLDEFGVKATFFLGGCWADDNAECVLEIAHRGHEIGSHGYFHREHDKLGYEENFSEIQNSVTLLAALSDQTIGLFAPPSGAYNDDTLSAAEALGLKTVLWSKDTIDWRDEDEDVCYRRATENIEGGDLVLMHPMRHTKNALGKILAFYLKSGFEVIPVGENIEGNLQT